MSSLSPSSPSIERSATLIWLEIELLPLLCIYDNVYYINEFNFLHFHFLFHPSTSLFPLLIQPPNNINFNSFHLLTSSFLLSIYHTYIISKKAPHHSPCLSTVLVSQFTRTIFTLNFVFNFWLNTHYFLYISLYLLFFVVATDKTNTIGCFLIIFIKKIYIQKRYEYRRNSWHLLFRSVWEIQCTRHGIARSIAWRFVWFMWPTFRVENCYHDCDTISK